MYPLLLRKKPPLPSIKSIIAGTKATPATIPMDINVLIPIPTNNTIALQTTGTKHFYSIISTVLLKKYGIEMASYGGASEVSVEQYSMGLLQLLL